MLEKRFPYPSILLFVHFIKKKNAFLCVYARFCEMYVSMYYVSKYMRRKKASV